MLARMCGYMHTTRLTTRALDMHIQIVAGVADAAPQGMFVKAVLPHLKELFAAPEWTAETLAIALAMQQNYPVCGVCV